MLRKFLTASVLSVWCLVGQSNHSGAPQQTKIDPDLLSQRGNYYALLIGNQDYPESSGFSKLETPVRDVQDIADILSTIYGFKVKLLFNASRDKIISSISEYRRTLNDSDNLLIYYAGHGYLDREAGLRAYWLPVDADKNSKANWISADDITGDLGAMVSRHVLVIADSCYSGAMFRDVRSAITPEDKNRFLLQVRAKKSRTLMTSGAIEPVADGGGAVNSIFAEALIQGLTSIEDAAFSAGTLFSDSVRVRVGGRANQTPLYAPLSSSGDQGGDFIFVRLPKVAAPGKSNSNTALESYNSGTLYSEDGKWAEAEAEYQKATALEPDNAVFRAHLGSALYSQRKYVEAEAAFRAATRLDPKNTAYWNSLGNCLYNQKRFQEAEEIYRKGVALDPQHFWLNGNLADTLNHLEDFSGAALYAKKAIEIAPQNAEAHHIYAVSLAGQHQNAAAAASFKRALELDPKPPETWNELGNVQWTTSDYNGAAASYRKAVELLPSNSVYHSNLSGALFNLGQFDQAEASARKALELSDTNPRAHYWLGRSLLATNRAAESEKPLRRAAILESTNADTHNWLADALLVQKKFEESVLEFKEAIRLEPANAYFYSNLADAYKQWNRPDLAEASYKEAMKRAPAGVDIQRHYGVFLFSQQRYQEAKDVAARIVAEEPAYWLNYENLGTVLVTMKDFAAAEQMLTKAIEMNKAGSADSYYNLGQALEGLGKLKPALDAFDKAAGMNHKAAAASAERLRKTLAENRQE